MVQKLLGKSFLFKTKKIYSVFLKNNHRTEIFIRIIVVNAKYLKKLFIFLIIDTIIIYNITSRNAHNIYI